MNEETAYNGKSLSKAAYKQLTENKQIYSNTEKQNKMKRYNSKRKI